MKTLRIIVAASGVALVASGCTRLLNKPTVVVAKPPETIASDETPKPEIKVDKVLYGQWNVAQVGTLQVTGDERPYVVFDTTGINPQQLKVYANSGCNIINGSVMVTSGGVMKKSGEFMSTMKYCADAPYETGINTAFENVASYSIEKTGNDYLMYLKNASGKALMALRKCDISFINGAWEVTKLGDNNLGSDDGLKLVIDVPELKVHGSTGCNILNGNLFIDPDKKNSLQFKDLATTRMMCPNLEREQAFLVALEQVERAEPGEGTLTAKLIDEDGNTLITLRRLNLKDATQIMDE